ncbi:hypothetical protein F4860DRAFT_510670 [Xylaria cubensis]|nr:hypothetical protein F4860DRAFT_510670 [Xylaria cubensis]
MFETIEEHADSPYNSFENTESDVESSDAGSEYPWDAWYRDIGYLPPLDECTIQLLAQITSNPATGRINPTNEDEFQEGLMERNVAFKPFTDPYLHSVKEIKSVASQETQEEKTRHDNTLRLDLEKLIDDPDEPMFQRTIMMAMIDRHRLIYSGGADTQRMIDFAAERLWTCPPMPTRVSMGLQPDGKFLTQPKPDLAIAFRREYLFPKYWEILPPATREIVCYEGKGATKTIRAFHFMTFEGKSSYKTADDKVALAQSLNNASQSLHNLYEFFNEAGQEHVDVFFSQVRFFSAVLCMGGIKIRIHRACRAEGYRGGTTQPDDAGHINQPVALVPVFPDYPLQFEYDEYFKADSTEFTRDNVMKVLEQIIVGYGVQVLSVCVRNAADAVVKKFRHHGLLLDRPCGFYSHGQKPPPARSANGLPTFKPSNTMLKRRRYT